LTPISSILFLCGKQDGGAALRKAAENGNLPAVKDFITRGARLDEQDEVSVADTNCAYVLQRVPLLLIGVPESLSGFLNSACGVLSINS